MSQKSEQKSRPGSCQVQQVSAVRCPLWKQKLRRPWHEGSSVGISKRRCQRGAGGCSEGKGRPRAEPTSRRHPAGVLHQQPAGLLWPPLKGLHLRHRAPFYGVQAPRARQPERQSLEELASAYCLLTAMCDRAGAAWLRARPCLPALATGVATAAGLFYSGQDAQWSLKRRLVGP